MQQVQLDLRAELPTKGGAWADVVRHLFGRKVSDQVAEDVGRRVLGESDSQVATELGVKPSTVKRYDRRFLDTFGLDSVRQIPFFVFQHLWRRYRRNA